MVNFYYFHVFNSQKNVTRTLLSEDTSPLDRNTVIRRYRCPEYDFNMSVEPTRSQLSALKSYPKDKPVAMVNVIKFRDKTPDGTEEGKAAYKRYITAAMPFVEAVGGKMIWRGKPAGVVVGNDDTKPDVVFIVEYPSMNAFFEILNNPDYQKIKYLRGISLEIGDLIACEM